MEKIIKFESFTLKNLSDLENWSTNYNFNKEKGILPYLKTKNGFEEVPGNKINGQTKYYWLDKNKVSELNNKLDLYKQTEKDYLDYLEEIQNTQGNKKQVL